MIGYLDMLPAERRYEIGRALQPILAGLGAPCDTALIVVKLARELGIKNQATQNILAADLLRYAKESPHATHDGKRFVRFGRASRGWRWHSTPVVSAETPPDTSYQAGVAQRAATAEEWTVNPWYLEPTVQAAQFERDEAGDLTERAGVLRDAIEFWRTADGG